MVDKPTTTDVVDRHFDLGTTFKLRFGLYAPSYPITLLRRVITNELEGPL